MAATRNQLLAKLLQSRSHGTVVLAIADANLQSAQERRILNRHQNGLEVEAVANAAFDALFLVCGERYRGVNQHAQPMRALLVLFARLRQNGANQIEPLMVVEDQQELEECFTRPRFE